MITINNNNFTSYKNIPLAKNVKKNPDVIFYENIFSNKISKIMLKKINKLDYETTEYCLSNNVNITDKKILWFDDDEKITYILSENKIFGLNSNCSFINILQCSKNFSD